jgi:hypothetical protein
MNSFNGTLLVVVLCLLSYRVYEIGELLRDRYEASVTAECTAPTVCRNEFGHRKEC